MQLMVEGYFLIASHSLLRSSIVELIEPCTVLDYKGKLLIFMPSDFIIFDFLISKFIFKILLC